MHLFRNVCCTQIFFATVAVSVARVVLFMGFGPHSAKLTHTEQQCLWKNVFVAEAWTDQFNPGVVQEQTFCPADILSILVRLLSFPPLSVQCHFCQHVCVWQHLEPPVCPMLSLPHSHSVTNVERTSSFHESSLSTRTRSWTSRMAATRNVSSCAHICTRLGPNTRAHTFRVGWKVEELQGGQCVLCSALSL